MNWEGRFILEQNENILTFTTPETSPYDKLVCNSRRLKKAFTPSDYLFYNHNLLCQNSLEEEQVEYKFCRFES